MREILFRGQRLDNGELVKGFYVIIASENHCIFTGRIDLTQGRIGYEYFKVAPETVGQYTGLYDATKWEALSESEQEEWLETHTADEWKGRKIFEGDILYRPSGRKEVVIFDNTRACFGIKHKDCFYELGSYYLLGAKVIGNIHDNYELLEGNNE